MEIRTTDAIARAAHAAVEAATWAPSLHNTQPWSFALSGDEISLRADPDRKLRVADPYGREMLISCGAALFNVRITLRALGWAPEIKILPDPERPLLLATVRVRPGETADEHTELLHGEIERRRTHRAGFTDMAVPERLVEALVAEADAQGAHLLPIRSEVVARVLAALTTAAQDVQSQDSRFSLEVMRWARPPGSTRRDGVPATSYPAAAPHLEPQHFAQRDYEQGHHWGGAAHERVSTASGIVAMLTTPSDGPREWLASGEALQRLLLHASAYGLSAAFHTQALEMAELREFIHRHLCSGEYPQMLMRLGFVLDEGGSVRRALSEVLDED
jgi:nitroreductase